MGLRSWERLVVGAVLLGLIGPVRLSLANAQVLRGGLIGKLTDRHSAPLENVAVTLRNAETGAEITATTSRGGRYSFGDLPAGEYTLAASGPGGSGEVGGIVISAGHQTRVQTVVEFGANGSEKKLAAEPDLPGESAWTRQRELLSRAAGGMVPEASVVAVRASLSPEALAALPLVGRTERTAPLLPHAVLIPAVHIAANVVAEIEQVHLLALNASSLAGELGGANADIAAPRLEVGGSAGESVDSAQLESLPMTHRDWIRFLGTSAVAADQGDESEADGGRSRELRNDARIDGQSLRFAFGGARAAGSDAGESAIRTVRSGRAGEMRSQPASVGEESVETRRGSEHLHGQLFVFDRQDVWGARSPFAQWVKETAPGLGASVPLFSAEGFSPADRELVWGVGAGGVLGRHRVFWFGALDGFERNNPAVATVRHPENFFVQPSNDQMQLLSAQLALSSVDPIAEGVGAYSKLLESLAGLLGPAGRSSLRLSGFGRADWAVGERHRFTFEGNGSVLNSPGGGGTGAWQTYGNHSLGSVRAANEWLLGRWSAFVTPNLLVVTQGYAGRDVQSAEAERPSAFEESLNINSWGQLPQIVVDSRDGFTIGNPARFGRGRYPDESAYSEQEQLKWVHGNLLLNAGAELIHERDATTRLRNQTGTYHYSRVEDFASDALAFAKFGMAGQLNPMDQHNCDQRGRPWRDSAGGLHGLGYLPCYSYYSQTLGPSEWWLSTNDSAGYLTSQWQANRRAVFTLAMRWERQQLPSPISKVDNHDLPLTQRVPGLGSQWGPRAGFAWGSGESRWPVVRVGYGMYFRRIPNATLLTALTQTGSLKGDVNVFMRPTDNLNGGGAPPFPYVLAGLPGSVVKPGAVEFAPGFRNGEVQQGEVSVEETLPGRVHLDVSGVASLGRRLPVTVDANIDPAVNPKTITYMVVDGNGSGPIKTAQITVPFYASWPSVASSSGFAGRLNSNYQEVAEIFSRANSTYEALLVRVSRNARGLGFRGRYTFGHAADWNPDEGVQVGGPSVLDPNDFRQEYGTSSLDVRHSATAAVILEPKWKLKELAGYVGNGWMVSGVGYFRSGLPYSMRTSGSLAKEFDVSGRAIVALSTGMNGYGGDNRVYGVGRNTYRYPATWKADLRIAKRFNLGQMRQLELMAESFNLFNHQNVTQVETVGYSIEQGTLNGALPRLSYLTGLKSGQTEFGKPLNTNATDFYRERQVQFGARMRF